MSYYINVIFKTINSEILTKTHGSQEVIGRHVKSAGKQNVNQEIYVFQTTLQK